MARKKKGEAHGGGHGWFVTFADLMGLLVAFFVMMVASSTQDKQKLQIVAGSMREAFGMQTKRNAGIVEIDGLPTRPRLKNLDKTIKPDDASATPTPDDKSSHNNYGASRSGNEGAFALASASLRQAIQNMPEIAEISKQVMIEETRQGLNIE